MAEFHRPSVVVVVALFVRLMRDEETIYCSNLSVVVIVVGRIRLVGD